MQQYHLSPTLMLGSGCRKQLPEHLKNVSGSPCVASEKDFYHIFHAAYEGDMPFSYTIVGE
jgi:hypothetical protein